MGNGTSNNGAVKYGTVARSPGAEKRSGAARTIAKGHQSRRWLTAVLFVSVGGNIVVPLWFTYQSRLERQVVLFDVSSGTLLLSPLVDPASSKELVGITGSWAARCLLDRNALGFDDPRLLELLFLRDAAKKANQEFTTVKQEYVDKNLRSKVEIKEIKGQAVGQGIILCRISGQVIITGVVHGEAIQEVQETTIDFKLVRNPDLGRNMRYPLAVADYAYVHDQ
jgi:hypothetical protein